MSANSRLLKAASVKSRGLLQELIGFARHKSDCTYGKHIPGRGDACEVCSCGLNVILVKTRLFIDRY